MGTRQHSTCDDLMRSIQNQHMDVNQWSDIAYNLCVCVHGVIFEGRGRGNGSAANGTTEANKYWYAVCALVGEGDPQPPELIAGLQEACNLIRSWGAGNAVNGHRDHIATACPGDALYSQVLVGTFNNGAASTPVPPPVHTETAPTFPLPSGHYFGPAEGPAESHSGYYSQADRDDLADWQDRMAERGWSIAVDGLYGTETEGVAADFQKEKGLGVDGLIGVETWGAAWTEPVT